MRRIGLVLFSEREVDAVERGPILTWLDWYNSLTKPSWTPTPATIGLIWQMLYPVILASFGFVFVQAIRKKVPWLMALPFAINLVANLIFTPIQFEMRNLPLASVDILIVLGTIIWMSVAVWKHYRWVAVAQVPYSIWVSIATMLQLSISIGSSFGQNKPCRFFQRIIAVLSSIRPLRMTSCFPCLLGCHSARTFSFTRQFVNKMA